MGPGSGDSLPNFRQSQLGSGQRTRSLARSSLRLELLAPLSSSARFELDGGAGRGWDGAMTVTPTRPPSMSSTVPCRTPPRRWPGRRRRVRCRRACPLCSGFGLWLRSWAHAPTALSQIGRVDAASRRSLVKGAAALRQMPTAAALLRVVVEKEKRGTGPALRRGGLSSRTSCVRGDASVGVSEDGGGALSRRWTDDP
jgi:hypothetical protein